MLLMKDSDNVIKRNENFENIQITLLKKTKELKKFSGLLFDAIKCCDTRTLRTVSFEM